MAKLFTIVVEKCVDCPNYSPSIPNCVKDYDAECLELNRKLTSDEQISNEFPIDCLLEDC